MTELIWDGKYDAQGKKVAPPRIALPFQTVETVNESAADRNRMQDLFASGRATARPTLSLCHSLARRRSCALTATTTVLSDISTAPTAGDSTIPFDASTPAASGMARIL